MRTAISQKIKKSGYIYLASPYSSVYSKIRNDRFIAAQKAILWLLRQRINAFSPIVQWHPIAVTEKLPKDFKTWINFNHTMIRRSSAVMILCIPGWKESDGIKNEISYSKRMNIPLFFLNPDHYDYARDTNYQITKG